MSNPPEQSLMPYEAVPDLGRGVVLVLAPHPDDEVFGCGGAIARHVAAGDPVSVVVATDGGFDDGAGDDDRGAYVARREEESRAAAALLGYGEPAFWRLPDRSLEYGERLVERVAEAIRHTGAEIVYAPSIYEMHPDHRVLGMCAVEAVRREKRAPWLAMYEVSTPLRPNRLLDITPLVDVKARAMSMFRSQLQRQAYDRHITALNLFRTYTLPSTVQAAEAYLVLGADELRNSWPDLYGSEVERYRRDGVDVDLGHASLVSVVIRGFGPPPELRRTLESLALQTHPRLEVIGVHAAGEPGTGRPAWCGRFPVRHVDCAVGDAPATMANAGLEAAAGNYVMLLNPGDLVAPDHVSSLAAVLDANGSAAVAVAVSGNAGNGDAREPAEAIPVSARVLCGPYLPLGAALIDRSLVSGNGARFADEFREFGDWDFWLQLASGATLLPRFGATFTAGGKSAVSHDEIAASRSAEWHAVRRRWRQKWSAEHLHDVLIEYDRCVSECMTVLRRSIDAERSRQLQIERELEATVERQRQLSTDLQRILDSRSWRATSLARHGSSALRRMLHRLAGGSSASH